MSRSNNLDLQNPAKHFLEWKSDLQMFQYWDKEIQVEGNEKLGANVKVPLPFRFLVLDQLNTIKGYSDSDGSGYWSNEVRSLKNESLTVRTRKGVKAKGLYDEVITDGNLTGAKFVKSVYIAYKENDELILANIQMSGCAMGQWIDFCKTARVMDGAIEVAETIHDKKGKTEFDKPVFTKIPVSAETDEAAKKLDIELQQYLTAYFKARKEIVEDEVVAQRVQEEEKQEVITRSEQPNTFTPPIDEKLPF